MLLQVITSSLPTELQVSGLNSLSPSGVYCSRPPGGDAGCIVLGLCELGDALP